MSNVGNSINMIKRHVHLTQGIFYPDQGDVIGQKGRMLQIHLHKTDSIEWISMDDVKCYENGFNLHKNYPEISELK